MANRKGVFIGAYVPAELKRDLNAAARREFRTLSQEVLRRLMLSLYNKAELPSGRRGRAATGGAREEEAVCKDGYRRHRFKEKGQEGYAKSCLRCGVARAAAPAV